MKKSGFHKYPFKLKPALPQGVNDFIGFMCTNKKSERSAAKRESYHLKIKKNLGHVE